MPTLPDPVRAAAAQLAETGAALGRAFLDDPAFVYVFPDREERERHLGWLLGLGARYGHLFGETYTAGSPTVGGAVWLPPGQTQSSPDRLVQAGFAEAPERLGAAAFGRFEGVIACIERLHAQAMPAPHWYLMVLGVDPPRQRRGLGGALMGPVLRRADRDGQTCYLETANERNLAFYRKHGFDEVAEADVPGGPHFWAMSRPPRPS